MDVFVLLRRSTGFQWDDGNSEKRKEKHGVSRFEAEELFFNQPLVVADDDRHSEEECRFFALGQTNRARLLFCVVTMRGSQIRVISVRDMTKKEREVYRSHG